MRFVIDLHLDGYEAQDELEAGCREFITEQLDISSSSIKIVGRAESVLAAMDQVIEDFPATLDHAEDGRYTWPYRWDTLRERIKRCVIQSELIEC